MRSLDANITSYLAGRSNVVCRALIWIEARDRDTNAAAPIGLWTGADVRTFTVGGVARQYYGAGSAISLDPIRRAVGMDVQYQSIRISAITAAAQQAIRGYELRLARIEIHRLWLDPASLSPVGGPTLEWEGVIEEAPISTPATGGEATCTIRAAGQARRLNMSSQFARSDAARRAAYPGDTFLKYATMTGEIGLDDPWGSADPAPSPARPTAGASGVPTVGRGSNDR